ncbi:unnamed protein product [Brachionus calyciflorus]|uniref:Snake toxin/toxin-like domain-containing protein n=1 Tax=Brachionus calyciflorus TaxID=104777 RepID=A0A813WFI4_9BILA|nr:unnamed protein product [Brachionus calyciflorus]
MNFTMIGLFLIIYLVKNIECLQCYSCEKCLEPFNPLAYNTKVLECPEGFDTCLTNFIEHSNGAYYSQRTCVPPYLCSPGVYTKNDTTITTKCCNKDLCINYKYFSFTNSMTSSTISRNKTNSHSLSSYLFTFVCIIILKFNLF